VAPAPTHSFSGWAESLVMTSSPTVAARVKRPRPSTVCSITGYAVPAATASAASWPDAFFKFEAPYKSPWASSYALDEGIGAELVSSA
jgi:hypothetical protein